MQVLFTDGEGDNHMTGPLSTEGLELRLFEGSAQDVELEVNSFLRMQMGDSDVVFVGYNYQGGEFVERLQIPGSATHGVCLLMRRKES